MAILQKPDQTPPRGELHFLPLQPSQPHLLFPSLCSGLLRIPPSSAALLKHMAHSSGLLASSVYYVAKGTQALARPSWGTPGASARARPPTSGCAPRRRATIVAVGVRTSGRRNEGALSSAAGPGVEGLLDARLEG